MSALDLHQLEQAIGLLRGVYQRLPPQSTAEELLLDAETLIQNAALAMAAGPVGPGPQDVIGGQP